MHVGYAYRACLLGLTQYLMCGSELGGDAGSATEVEATSKKK